MKAGAWARRPSSLVLLASAGIAALGMFTLAWSVSSPGGRTMSMSYAVGYDNRVAWVALLASCGVAFAAGRLRRREGVAAHAGDPAGEVTAPGRPGVGPVPRIDVIVLSAAVSVAFSAFATATFGIPLFDNTFFFDRVAQVLGGAAPWRDFYFPYGPLMLYLPAGLSWLAARLGAPAVLGYYVALGVSQVAGILLLAWVIGRLPLAPERRRKLFWVFGACAAFGVFGGLNYTPVRFLAPVASVLLLAAWRSGERRLPPLALGAASLGLATANLAVSPEMGVSCAVAAFVLLATGQEAGARRWLAPSVLLLGLAALAAALGGVTFDALAPLAGGAYRFPVLPSPYVLAYAGTALYVSFALGSRPGGSAVSDPVAAVFVAGLALVPSALGRADFGHVLWNGLAVFLAGAVLIATLPGRRFAVWAGALALVFPLWSGVGLYDSAPAISAAAIGAPRAPGAGLGPPARSGRVAMPFGPADTLGFELARSGRLVPLMCDENGPADAAQLGLVTRQLEGAEWVVVPADVARVVSSRIQSGDIPLDRMPAYGGWQAAVILQLPVDIRMRRAPYEGRYELGLEIGRTFEPVESTGRYVVFRRTDSRRAGPSP